MTDPEESSPYLARRDLEAMAATFFESVCHLPDKLALFREINRVLKPGGRLGGTDWVQPFATRS